MKKIAFIILSLAILLSACQPATPKSEGLKVLAVESVLADMAQNVAGDRLVIETLIPLGMDPHTYEPVPRDVVQIAKADVLIINGAGFEAWLEKTLSNAGGKRLVVETSRGLPARQAREGEAVMGAEQHDETDPHFWLDPVLAQQYVLAIRDGLIQVDAAGRETYTRNAQVYIEKLKELHTWIEAQLVSLPKERRKLVTNHESFGYFADRYGFTIVGTLLPGVSTGASPSAQQLARLVDQIRATGTQAIFLEGGANVQLAEQVAREANVKVVTGLYTHSLTPPDGKAPGYIEMMKQNVLMMVVALK